MNYQNYFYWLFNNNNIFLMNLTNFTNVCFVELYLNIILEILYRKYCLSIDYLFLKARLDISHQPTTQLKMIYQNVCLYNE